MSQSTNASRIFFTSDQHFGHENIIKYCHRPYTGTEQMDNDLITRWNSLVEPEDTVYHLGDVTLGERAREYFSELNGNIFVLENSSHHDRRWLKAARTSYFPRGKNGRTITLLPPLVTMKFSGVNYGIHPVPFTLCHFPLAQWEMVHYGGIHLHGHTHGTYHGKGRIMDVGVDSVNFYPVSLAAILLEFYGGSQDAQ